MNRGHVLEDAFVAVNMWNIGQEQDVRLFFLTSFHNDHLEGLISSWSLPIYTTNITARLLQKRYEFLSPHICPLDFGTPHILPPNFEDYYVVVTLLDANHSPGSTMFLFEGSFGTILYTGDFRSYPSLLPQLELHTRPIDLLYFDNTYCQPYCNFPLQSDLISEIIDFVKQFIGKSRIMIGCDLFGKEEVFVRVHKETKRKFTVNKYKMNMLENLGIGHIANTECEPVENGLFLIDSLEINGQNVKKWSNEMPTQIVLLTAKYVGAAVKPFRKHKNVRVFPYSSHCNFDELVEFVKEVRPLMLIPIIEQPLKVMFDKGQGSLESVQTLIEHASKEMNEITRNWMKNSLTKFISHAEKEKKRMSGRDDHVSNDNIAGSTNCSNNVVRKENPLNIDYTTLKARLPAQIAMNKQTKKSGENKDVKELVSSLPNKVCSRSNGQNVKSVELPILSTEMNKVSHLQTTQSLVRKLPDFPNDLNEYFNNSQLNSSQRDEYTNCNEKNKTRNMLPESSKPNCVTMVNTVKRPFPRYNYLPNNQLEEIMKTCSTIVRTKDCKSRSSSPIRKRQNIIQSSRTGAFVDNPTYSTNSDDFAHGESHPPKPTQNISKEVNQSETNPDLSITDYKAVLEDIPSCFLDLIRKRQRRKLRQNLKCNSLNTTQADNFLSQEVNIIYKVQNSICKGYRLKNKRLLK